MIPPLRIRFLPLSAGLALSLSVSTLRAQDRVEAARETSLQTTPGVAVEGRPGEAAGEGAVEMAQPMEGDEEFGVQRILYRRANWEPWGVGFNFGGFYTSNVALADRGEENDFFLQSGLSLSYTPQIKGGLFARAGLSEQIFRYADADVFDFDLLRAQAGVLYAFPRSGTAYDPLLGDLLLFADYNYYRISEPWKWGDDNFDNHSVSLGAQKIWRFSRGHSLAFGLTGDWSLEASRPEPRRDEYAAVLAWRVKWTGALESTAAYRAAIYDYRDGDRTDFNQVLSLGLEYKITDWLSANANISGIFNNSDREQLDYKSLNTGVSVFFSSTW